MAAIITSCLIAMFQTINAFQFTPMDSITCGGYVNFCDCFVVKFDLRRSSLVGKLV